MRSSSVVVIRASPITAMSLGNIRVMVNAMVATFGTAAQALAVDDLDLEFGGDPPLFPSHNPLIQPRCLPLGRGEAGPRRPGPG